MLPEIAFQKIKLPMTATVEDVNARWHEIANDPEMKLTAESRFEIGLLREACKWARKYIRDPGSCKSMTPERYAEFVQKNDPNYVDESWEFKYKQLSVDFDVEVKRMGKVKAELQQENFALRDRVAELEAQNASQSKELNVIKAHVKDAVEEWKRNECQVELRDVLIDKLFKERTQHHAELAASRKGFKDVMGFLDGVHDLIAELKEDCAGQKMLFSSEQALAKGGGQTNKRKHCETSRAGFQ